MLADVSQPQDARFLDQNAEDTVAHGERADGVPLLLGEPACNEFDDPTLCAEDTQSAVPGTRGRSRELNQPLQHCVKRQLGGKGQSRFEEHLVAVGAPGHPDRDATTRLEGVSPGIPGGGS